MSVYYTSDNTSRNLSTALGKIDLFGYGGLLLLMGLLSNSSFWSLIWYRLSKEIHGLSYKMIAPYFQVLLKLQACDQITTTIASLHVR